MADATTGEIANLSIQNPSPEVFRRIAIHFGQLSPTGSISFSYLTEGAANVVWTIRFHDSNLSKHDSAAVFRMRKDIASTVPMTELKSQFEERIAPLFTFDPSLLLPVDLVMLSPGVVEELNVQLRLLETTGKRKASRRGIYHPTFETESYAMFMPNLGYGNGKVVEFKPKWLVQSPSAPRSARRCRTCALNTMRRAKGSSGRGDMGFCPFDLLSRNRNILSGALKQVWKDEDTLNGFVEAFIERIQPALRQLQQLQRANGNVGLMDFQNPDGKDFSVAMALRDCSVVLKAVPSDNDKQLEISTVKLLDLDLKDTGGGKLAKWARMEAEMIDEGWYTIQPVGGIECAMAFQ